MRKVTVEMMRQAAPMMIPTLIPDQTRRIQTFLVTKAKKQMEMEIATKKAKINKLR